MTDLTSIQKYRQRAIEVLEERYGDDHYLLIDYTIDDECRNALKLPPRPVNTSPYETWMVGKASSPAPVNRTSDSGIGFIKNWEGLRTRAYQCSARVWTIGYGHTKGVKSGDVITKREARRLLQEDLLVFETTVSRVVQVPLNQNQFDALVSLAFNIGVSGFSNSTLVERLNKGQYQQAADEFLRWCWAGKKKLPGLQARRRKERELFLS